MCPSNSFLVQNVANSYTVMANSNLSARCNKLGWLCIAFTHTVPIYASLTQGRTSHVLIHTFYCALSSYQLHRHSHQFFSSKVQQALWAVLCIHAYRTHSCIVDTRQDQSCAHPAVFLCSMQLSATPSNSYFPAGCNKLCDLCNAFPHTVPFSDLLTLEKVLSCVHIAELICSMELSITPTKPLITNVQCATSSVGCALHSRIPYPFMYH